MSHVSQRGEEYERENKQYDTGNDETGKGSLPPRRSDFVATAFF